MPQFQVTHSRQNDTADGSAPESTLTVTILAATPEGAAKKAEGFWTDQGQWDDSWDEPTVVNLEAD